MYKITNIETLGTEYTVANKEGKFLKNIRIIPHTEILDAALGPLNESFNGLSDYINQSIAVLAGNEDVNLHNIYWHAVEAEEPTLEEVIEYAIKHNYSIVITEQIEPALH